MREYRTNRRRVRAVVAAAALTLTVAMQWGTGIARAEDDEENVPLDTKLLRQFMKDLGLQREGQGAGSIQYRERAPLVVPPSRNLPPPQDAASVAANPAWPKDPDVKQRKVDAIKASKKPQRTAAEAMIADGSVVPRDQLDRPGKVDASSVGGSPTPEESARPLRPSELGESKSIWSNMFSSFKKEGETATFTGEPPRTSLTEPPPGYLTPSPNQPYGIGPEVNKKKALTLEERTTPSNSQ
jgi:hypothetical protein